FFFSEAIRNIDNKRKDTTRYTENQRLTANTRQDKATRRFVRRESSVNFRTLESSMPSGRYNKKKKEKKKIEEEQNNENVESRKTSKSSRHFYNQTLDAAQRKRGCEDHSKIDSSIITTKRLTVGVKGIFGNARNSNSVYREFQKKLDKRKLSKEVSSEIEQNLSKIFPNRKKCNCTNRSSTSTESHNEETRYQTPSVNGNNNSTPHSQLRSFKTRSHQANQSVQSASSTKCSTHSTRRRRNNSSTTSLEGSTNSISCNELTHSTTPIVQ
uniref:Uncharacterized protein n=1 Tax=Clytia hemisphaerica TaxID=252671 RepID=A0A7M6DQ89_9CNID